MSYWSKNESKNEISGDAEVGSLGIVPSQNELIATGHELSYATYFGFETCMYHEASEEQPATVN